MARQLCLDAEGMRLELTSFLKRATESASLNFILGSGCSCPAIPVLGNVEETVRKLRDEGREEEVGRALIGYLKHFTESTNALLGDPDGDHKVVLQSYSTFLAVLSGILLERKSNIAPKHACIFTTNYDLFFEKAYEEYRGSLVMSDGFDRRPSLENAAEFSTAEFFKSISKRGTLYSYEVQLPSASLLKLHGSLNWHADGSRILCSVKRAKELEQRIQELERPGQFDEYSSLIEDLPLIMPVGEKHRDTLLVQIYYDLLRIYPNELDKENVLLLACGVSFDDEHILEITRRSLRNPTLRLVIFSHTQKGAEGYASKYEDHENVDIVYSKKSLISFTSFSELLKDVLPTIHGSSEGVDGAGEDADG